MVGLPNVCPISPSDSNDIPRILLFFTDGCKIKSNEIGLQFQYKFLSLNFGLYAVVHSAFSLYALCYEYVFEEMY